MVMSCQANKSSRVWITCLLMLVSLSHGFTRTTHRRCLNMKLEFRNAKAEDISAIASLCSETFEGPFAWYQSLQKANSIKGYTQQLNERYERLVLGGIKHSMCVAIEVPDAAEATSSPSSSSPLLVGFLEMGMLPSPIAEEVEWQGAMVKSNIEKPYLGNVAVAESARRRGIGSKLIRIGMKMAEKWRDSKLLVAVDASNTQALAMYKKLGFVVILDERDSINMKVEPRLFLEKSVETVAPPEAAAVAAPSTVDSES